MVSVLRGWSWNSSGHKLKQLVVQRRHQWSIMLFLIVCYVHVATMLDAHVNMVS